MSVAMKPNWAQEALNSLAKFWPILLFVGGLLWAAITRDIAQEARLAEQDKYGSTWARQQFEMQAETNRIMAQAFERLAAISEGHEKRLDKLEEGR